MRDGLQVNDVRFPRKRNPGPHMNSDKKSVTVGLAGSVEQDASEGVKEGAPRNTAA